MFPGSAGTEIVLPGCLPCGNAAILLVRLASALGYPSGQRGVAVDHMALCLRGFKSLPQHNTEPPDNSRAF